VQQARFAAADRSIQGNRSQPRTQTQTKNFVVHEKLKDQNLKCGYPYKLFAERVGITKRTWGELPNGPSSQFLDGQEII
jgi:hypothetical protein